jgi:hypothetical protein
MYHQFIIQQLKKHLNQMKNRIFISLLLFFNAITIHSQSSLSVNYLYNDGKEKYALPASKKLVKHGIGVQGKIYLKNQFYLMPDIAYFFSDYENKIYHGTALSPTNFRETELRYYTANINLAYTAFTTENFRILPFIGAGFFLEDLYQLLHHAVDPQNPGAGGVTMIVDKQIATSITCNLGFAIELHLKSNIFITAGTKYIIDIYDTKYNCFPYVNIGIGYSF